MKLGRLSAKIIGKIQSALMSCQSAQPAISLYDYDYAPCTPNIAAVPHSDAETSQGNLSGENKFDLSLHIGQIGPRGKAAQPGPTRVQTDYNRYFWCVSTKWIFFIIKLKLRIKQERKYSGASCIQIQVMYPRRKPSFTRATMKSQSTITP